MIENVEEGQHYRNKKTRNIYQVADFATHSETLETMVIYYSMKDVHKLWVRPLELFKEKFEEM
jgi:hypothetical protein